MLPKPFGPFKDGTVFADETGRVVQIRCVAKYAPAVEFATIVDEIERLVPEIEKHFGCMPVKGGLDHSKAKRWCFKGANDSGLRIQVYVGEARNQDRPLGYFIGDMTLFWL